MKKTIHCIALATSCLLALNGCVSRTTVVREEVPAGAVVVSERPPEPLAESRPHRPHRDSVWVPGYWAWNGSRYNWVHGYWATPSSGYDQWVPGYWTQTDHGWVWVPGHWARS